MEYIFELLIEGGDLPTWTREHELEKRSVIGAGFLECQVGPDLLMIYHADDARVRMSRIGSHRQLLGP